MCEQPGVHWHRCASCKVASRGKDKHYSSGQGDKSLKFLHLHHVNFHSFASSNQLESRAALFSSGLASLIIFNISHSIWLCAQETSHWMFPGWFVLPGAEFIFKTPRIKKDDAHMVHSYTHKAKPINILISQVSAQGLDTLGLDLSLLCPGLAPCVWLAVCEEQPSVWEESSSFGRLFVRNKTSSVFVLVPPHTHFFLSNSSLKHHQNMQIVHVNE